MDAKEFFKKKWGVDFILDIPKKSDEANWDMQDIYETMEQYHQEKMKEALREMSPGSKAWDEATEGLLKSIKEVTDEETCTHSETIVIVDGGLTKRCCINCCKVKGGESQIPNVSPDDLDLITVI